MEFMLKKLHLVFLWHMHQPYYKDDFTGEYLLPWVFLHAIKDYYEMPWHVSKFNIKAVFNLVPSLIVQLNEYAEGKANDIFLETLKKDVDLLSVSDKQKFIPLLFMSNPDNMITPFKRYKYLYNKFKKNEELTNQEIIDSEVLFLLSWTGNFIRKDSEFVKYLIDKGSLYTNLQKTELINSLIIYIGKIIPFYEKLAHENKIELSTTPFYHPILPLLLNPLSAKEAKPDIKLPKIICNFEKYAYKQVEDSNILFKEIFNFAPQGMWPAEGSISNEAVKCFSDNGITWIASDENVLSNSLGQNLADEKFRNELYKPYYFDCNGKKINIFFRDKILSDLIGFTYSNMNAEKASDDFINKLRFIYNKCDFEPVVSVILDGENAWEYYHKNATPFFENLYEKLLKENWLEVSTFSEILKIINSKKIKNIVAGSWIYGDFTTWIGHEEKNKAWELIANVYNNVKNTTFNDKDKYLIEKEFNIALGSDWFWWYGDDHINNQADVFDYLFRKHLQNIYKLANIPVERNLFQPIKKIKKYGAINKPTHFISPKIDGELTSFFEWKGCGIFDLKYDLGSMHKDEQYLQKLYWGNDSKMFYFKIDGDIKKLKNKNLILTVEFEANVKKSFSISTVSCKIINSKNFNDGFEKLKIAINNFIEMAIPLSEILYHEKVFIQFTLYDENGVIEKAPIYNFAELRLNNNKLTDWFI
jgi:alpha-amylase/alpha-mannosidase (GH57 family)